jgi:uncharacterized protein
MRLTQERVAEFNGIRSYDEASVSIGERVLRGPCAVSPQALLESWPAVPPAQLRIAQLQSVLQLKPALLILATSQSIGELDRSLRAALNELAIGLEVMERGAACRTYNVLAAEGRQVVLLLW